MRLAQHFLGLAALAMLGAAAAQDYPAKPIRAIVPFPPGGVVDIVARTVGQKMSEGLGQPLLVENRGGAGGSIGTDAAAKAPADGYSILFAFDTHAVNPHVYKTIRFDTLKDFAPVALIVNIPLVVAALPSFPASSMKELVDLARAKPGVYSYASVGAGSSGHLAAEQFKLLTGINLVHVPYKGGAPAVTDLLGGQVHLAIIAAGAAVPHLRANRLKGLAVSGAKRSGAMPNVPTMAESGYPQLQSGAWVGLLVPMGTPAPVIARLNAEVLKAIQDPALVAKLAQQSIEVAGSTPEQFGAFIRAEHEKWGTLIRDAKLNLEQ
jgi:tripartite-type tricarboxylate transporter receptor subunit TctC